MLFSKKLLKNRALTLSPFSLAEQLDGNGSDCAVSAPRLSEFVMRSSLTALSLFKGYGSKGLSG